MIGYSFPDKHNAPKVLKNVDVESKDLMYINASFINVPIKSREPKAFIAAQYPVKASLGRFWTMLFQQNVETIINLCSENAPECAVRIAFLCVPLIAHLCNCVVQE